LRVKSSDIDPELRGAAGIAGLVMRPSRWFFQLMLAGTKRTHGKTIDGLGCDEVHIARGDGTTIRTRIFKPLNAPERLPALLYLPGGGYAIGAPETFLPTIQDFIEARPCVVVSPDYRKSLDAPYPAAIDDCYTALLWLKDNADTVGARSDQIMVGGHSAGGGLTAAVSLRARDRGDVKIAFQMPIYPMIDDRNDTESARDNNAPLWSAKHNRLGWDLYLANLTKSGAQIPHDAAPARATDYSGLPPTLTYVGDIECFRDETIFYVENLRRAGVPVEFELFKGCYHGFDMVGRDSAIGRRARQFMLDGFARAVDTRFAQQ
jgi:acetyl esterase/lipase